VLFEVVKEGSVRQVLETGGIVGHDVVLSWEEVRDVAVAVEALVVAGEPAQGGSSTASGDGPLSDPRDGRGVVREVFDGGIVEGFKVAH
jgi:hypothetical protein